MTVAKNAAGTRIVVGGNFNGATTATALGTLTNAGAAGTFDGVVVVYNATGTPQWQARFGSTGDDQVGGVGYLSGGDVVVLLSYSGTVTFGGISLTSQGGPKDAAVVRLNGTTGAVVWATPIASGTGDVSLSASGGLVVDSSDRITVTGQMRGAGAFGAFSLTTGDAFLLGTWVAQLTAGGSVTWARMPTTFTGTVRSYGIAVDGSGNLAIGGSFGNDLNWGGATVTAVNALTDGFVVSLTSAGVQRWTKSWGASDGNEVTNGVAVDASGNVYMTGQSIKSFTLGSALTNQGGSDAIVAKYAAADGAVAWGKDFGGVGNEYGYGIAVDSAGAVLLGITTGSTPLTIGAFTPAAFGGNDIVTAKLSQADGSVLTAKRIGGPSSDSLNQGTMIAFGLDEVFTGFSTGAFAANSVTLSNAGAADMLVVRTVVTP